jgi:hypothetical protein
VLGLDKEYGTAGALLLKVVSDGKNPDRPKNHKRRLAKNLDSYSHTPGWAPWRLQFPVMSINAVF